MLPYPSIDPVAFHIGPLLVRWYGLSYIFSFLTGYVVIWRLNKKTKILPKEEFPSLLGWSVLGTVLGGRVGFILFYDLPYYIHHPQYIASIWRGGMSFHGAVIGMALTLLIYTRVHRLSFLSLSDMMVTPAPIGLGVGRLANFINGELWGRPSHVPWAMIFPTGGSISRHPSQIYEALGEGVLLLCILLFSYGRMIVGRQTALFFVGYGSIRFILEFFRSPDPQIGLLLHFFTLGQILCLLFVLFGIGLWVYAGNTHKSHRPT